MYLDSSKNKNKNGKEILIRPSLQFAGLSCAMPSNCNRLRQEIEVVTTTTTATTATITTNAFKDNK